MKTKKVNVAEVKNELSKWLKYGLYFELTFDGMLLFHLEMYDNEHYEFVIKTDNQVFNGYSLNDFLDVDFEYMNYSKIVDSNRVGELKEIIK